MYTKPSFPDQVWDGTTANHERKEGVNSDCDPNAADWDRIAAEVIAAQESVAALIVSEGRDIDLVWRGTWDANTVYAVNDLVAYQGSSYICTSGGKNHLPTGDGWGLIAAKGATGTDGTEGSPGEKGDKGDPGSVFVWKGPWAAETTYAANDLVTHSGAAYVAKDESTGAEPPSAHWDLLVAKGDQGEQGEHGEPGRDSNLPDPSALSDGEYKLHMASGVATWVAIT